jgi:hypothetical protein
LRRYLLECVKAFGAGVDPPGLDPAIAFQRICSELAVAPADRPWQEVCLLDAGLVARTTVPAASHG